MANLKTLSGFPIQNLTSDPVPFAQAKTNDPYQGTWASGAALNTSRIYPAGIGTTNSSALAVGGFSGTAAIANNESYNGTSWTELNDLNSGRYGLNGRGTSTSGIVYAGITTARVGNTETWDGTNWTEVNDLSTVRYRAGASGTQTAALCFGGENPGGADIANNESWNGSTWTELADLNTARNGLSGGGTQTDGLAFAGETTVATGATEIWNGSAWTEVADLNTARFRLAGASQVQNASLAIAGGPPNTAATEDWNGSVWTEVNDLSTARHALGGTGSNTSAIAFGGETPSVAVSNLTEEWAFSGIPPTAPAAGYSDAIVGQMYYNSTSGQFKAIKDGGQPVGTWASASGINTGRSYFAGAGTATDSMVFGGYATPGTPTGTTEDTEIWNGSSWTEVSNLNEAPYYNMAGSGASSTAALCYSGQGAGSRKNNAESWNGSSWTEITGINTARSGAAGVGPQTAAMCFGGNTYNPPPSVVYQALTEIWNGSSWTEVNDLNTARGDIAPVGSVYTDVLAVSGGSPNKTNNESFNGSTWTELADTNTTASSRSGSGVPAGPTAIVSGGYAPGVTANTEAWDGSSWTETGDLATARGKSAESASSTTGFQVGGETPSTPKNTNVEEFSFTDFDITTLTTS